MRVEGFEDDNKRHRVKFHKNNLGDIFTTFGTGTYMFTEQTWCLNKSIDVILQWEKMAIVTVIMSDDSCDLLIELLLRCRIINRNIKCITLLGQR